MKKTGSFARSDFSLRKRTNPMNDTLNTLLCAGFVCVTALLDPGIRR